MPGESPDTLPGRLTGPAAGSLLGAWTLAWRPAALVACGGAPRFLSLDQLPKPEELADRLLLVPKSSDSPSTSTWLAEVAATPGALVVRVPSERRALPAEAFDLPSNPGTQTPWDADFYALGLAALQTARLTRQMLGRSSMDLAELGRLAVEGAQSALQGDGGAVHDKLALAFGLIDQARNSATASEVSIVELGLTTDAVLGGGLQRELESQAPFNLLLTPELAEKVAVGPQAEAVRRRLANGDWCLVLSAGGSVDPSGTAAADLDPESLRCWLVEGRVRVRGALGVAPEFCWIDAGAIPPRFTAVVEGLGFRGAILTALDGSPFAWPDQARTRLVGIDGVQVEAIAAPPQDTAAPETGLRIAESVAASLRHEHSGTLLFAGWLGTRCEAVEDLERAARWTSALGKYVTLASYFDNRPSCDYWTHLTAERVARFAARAKQTPSAGVPASLRSATTDRALQSLANVAGKRDLTEVASLVIGQPSSPSTDQSSATPAPGLLLNPWSFPVASPHGEIPGFGFRAAGAAPQAAGQAPPRAEGRTLRNELLEATVSEKHGGLGALRVHGSRRGVAAQRLVLTRTGPLEEAECGVRLTRCEITRSDDQLGQIESAGDLLDRRGDRIATFRQQMTLPARRAGVALEIEIDRSSSTRVQIAHRLGWNGVDGVLSRGVQWARLEVGERRFWAGDYVEARTAAGVVTLAPQGMFRHVRVGADRLDTELPPGQTIYRFELGIGWRFPMEFALSSQQPWVGFGGRGQSSPSTAQASWWLHLDRPGVLVTRIEPLEASGGLMIGLIETEGRSAPLRLRSWRPILQAWECSLTGDRLHAIEPEGGAISVHLPAYGWLQAEVAW